MRSDELAHGSLAFRDARATAAGRSRRATPADAFDEAVRAWRRGERLDMVALATTLGVSRATLYRWTGDREQLLSDVLWADFDKAADLVESQAATMGRQRLEDVFGALIDLVAESPLIRGFLLVEGNAGLHIIISPAGSFRRRLVARAAALIEREQERGAYRAPAPCDVLSDGVIALGERFLHHGEAAVHRPDPATAKQLLHLLLREDPLP